MRPAGFVVVGKYHRIPTAEELGELGPPLAGALAVAGGDEPQLDEVVDVLFALGDVDRGVERRRDQLRQPIGDAPHPVEFPGPAGAIRSALFEAPGLVPNRLIEQLAGFVPVVIGGGDMPPLYLLALGLDINTQFVAKPAADLAIADVRLGFDQRPCVAADLGLVIEPLAGFRAGDIDRDAAVAAKPQLLAGRERDVRRTKHAPGDGFDMRAQIDHAALASARRAFVRIWSRIASCFGEIGDRCRPSVATKLDSQSVNASANSRQ